MLIVGNPKHQHHVLTQWNMDDIWAWLGCSSCVPYSGHSYIEIVEAMATHNHSCNSCIVISWKCAWVQVNIFFRWSVVKFEWTYEHTEILTHFLFIKCYFKMQKLASGAVWMSMVMGPVLCEMAFNLRGVRYCQWSNTQWLCCRLLWRVFRNYLDRDCCFGKW